MQRTTRSSRFPFLVKFSSLLQCIRVGFQDCAQGRSLQVDLVDTGKVCLLETTSAVVKQVVADWFGLP